MQTFIHETAFIHPKAHVENSIVGAHTKVWQFASIIRGAIIGEYVTVATGATIECFVGDRSIISHNVAMGPGFHVGNDVFIGPQVTFANDRWPATHKIGFDAVKLKDMMAIIIRDGAAIGANAVLLPGIVVGERAMVAAGAVATRDVPADHLFRRDGTITLIKNHWRQRRMAFAALKP